MTEHKARPKVGAEFYLPRYGFCVVEPGDDPSLVVLRVPSGAVIRLGEKALREMLIEAERQDAMRERMDV